MSLSKTLGPYDSIGKEVTGDPMYDLSEHDFLRQDILKGEFDFAMIPTDEWHDLSLGLSSPSQSSKLESSASSSPGRQSRNPSALSNQSMFSPMSQDMLSPTGFGQVQESPYGISGQHSDTLSMNHTNRTSSVSTNAASPTDTSQINILQSSPSPEYKPPFVLDLKMICKTMEGVNRALGVDLGGTEVSESVLQGRTDDDPESGSENSRDATSSKSEMSHIRLISDACGYIVASVGTAVLQAALDSHKENVMHGTPNKPPKAPVRKKRGGILGFKELAMRANLSPWHFHRVFRFVTGVTPKAYGEALWEYLMIEHGFNLDNEELSLIRSANYNSNNDKSKSSKNKSENSNDDSSKDDSSKDDSSKDEKSNSNNEGNSNIYNSNIDNIRATREGSSEATIVTSSSSSSSSPQSPVVGTQSLSAPTKSFSKPPQTSGTHITPNGEQTALAPLTGPVVPGRVRKGSSKPRVSRSRSRNRSQTQSQVLNALVGDSNSSEGTPLNRGRSFSGATQRPTIINVDKSGQGVFSSKNGPIQNGGDQQYYSHNNGEHGMMQPCVGLHRGEGSLPGGLMSTDFTAVEFISSQQMYPYELPDMTNLNLDPSNGLDQNSSPRVISSIENTHPNQAQSHLNIPQNQQRLYVQGNTPNYFINDGSSASPLQGKFFDGSNSNNKNASTIPGLSQAKHVGVGQGVNPGDSSDVHSQVALKNSDQLDSINSSFPPTLVGKSNEAINNFHQQLNSNNKHKFYHQSLGNIERDAYLPQPSHSGSHESTIESSRTIPTESLQESLQWEVLQQQNGNESKHDQLSDLPASFYPVFDDHLTTPFRDESPYETNISSVLIGDEDPPLMPEWDGNETSYQI